MFDRNDGYQSNSISFAFSDNHLAIATFAVIEGAFTTNDINYTVNSTMN